MGYKHNDTCLQKAKDDEPIFVLRAQDISSSKLVILWLAENWFGIPEVKAREAFEHALKMKVYPSTKSPD